MLNRKMCLVLIIVCSVACGKKKSPGPVVPPVNYISVLTQHNDNTRAGLNSHETKLTTANVNGTQFGKLFSLSVDDQVYAQPLVVANVSIGTGIHNVVYIATVNNSVYAFDADNGDLYWQKNFTAAGFRPPKNTDMSGACGGNYLDFSGNIGIVGTPVIDSSAQTIYFVARSTDGISYVQYLHAVNIVSGSEMPGSPVVITATYAGIGSGNLNYVITFDAQIQNQRQALTLVNGVVYVTFSSHCDWGAYHGWILGYNQTSLQQQIVYNDTPDGSAGGIWESGMGMAADSQGNLFCVTGNGSEGANGDPTVGRNRAESALKLTPSGDSLQVRSFFTPYNYAYLDSFDRDYGSMGAFLIPQSNYFFTGCKDGNVYLLNKDNMGGCNTGSDIVQQNINLSPGKGLHCQPSYYKGANNELIYIWTEKDQLRAIPFNRGSDLLDMSDEVVSTVAGPTGWSGALLSVSSNGTTAGTGIVWASYASSGNANQSVRPGILRAFDATNVSQELWDNNQNASDAAGNYAKFSTPTIANGHVYLATFSNQVVVYGLK